MKFFSHLLCSYYISGYHRPPHPHLQLYHRDISRPRPHPERTIINTSVILPFAKGSEMRQTNLSRTPPPTPPPLPKKHQTKPRRRRRNNPRPKISISETFTIHGYVSISNTSYNYRSRYTYFSKKKASKPASLKLYCTVQPSRTLPDTRPCPVR